MSPTVRRNASWKLVGLLFLALVGCQHDAKQQSGVAEPAKSTVRVETSASGVKVTTSSSEFVLSSSGALTASLVAGGSRRESLEASPMEGGQIVSADGRKYDRVELDTAHAEVREATGKLGKLGEQIEVKGKIPESNFTETLKLEVYDDFPSIALTSLQLRNEGAADITIESVELQRHIFEAPRTEASSKPTVLWTFQGSSLKWGKDEIFAMPVKFEQDNPMGAPVPTKDDLGSAGGGIPVVAFWSQKVGEAIGHIETFPLVLSIPVRSVKGAVNAGVRVPGDTILKPGEVFSTPRTFLAIYAGDFYEPLSLWSNMLEKEGLAKPANNDENYAVSWCGWGYEFGVTPKQMLDTIPKLKELGIHWATLDDGWFRNYGDWEPRSPAFAGSAITDMVKQFHEQGIKVQLWWLPLGVEDGHYGYGGRKYEVADVVKQHPEWLVLDESGKPARMARNLATLCPALPEVREYYKKLTERFIRDWGFDGHKLDNIYSVPRCYNPKHHHKSPNESVYAMGEVYKTIFETTRALKPDSVTQSCPCGTPPSLAWLRYMDQAVTADPVGAVQVRRRVKMYKALLGPRAAIYGDHVELTRVTHTFTDHEEDTGQDFASTLGTGGVLGTKFTWPAYRNKIDQNYLNPEKEEHWKKWIALYNDKLLSKGNFLNLYVYGFDFPEAYAIEKSGNIYYAFYATDHAVPTNAKAGSQQKWSGEVELRGLAARTYRVTDYVNQKDLGLVTGPNAKLNVQFSDNLLLEATLAQ